MQRRNHGFLLNILKKLWVEKIWSFEDTIFHLYHTPLAISLPSLLHYSSNLSYKLSHSPSPTHPTSCLYSSDLSHVLFRCLSLLLALPTCPTLYTHLSHTVPPPDPSLTTPLSPRNPCSPFPCSSLTLAGQEADICGMTTPPGTLDPIPPLTPLAPPPPPPPPNWSNRLDDTGS